MYLFADISAHLPEPMRAGVYPFPFRKDALERVFSGQELVLPLLLQELPVYLAEFPEMCPRYKDAAVFLTLNLGTQALEKEQYLLAVGIFQAGLSCDPQNSDLKSGMGRAYILAGDLTQGIESLGWLLGVEPRQEHLPLAILLAKSLHATGATAPANDLAQAYLKAFPGDGALIQALEEMTPAPVPDLPAINNETRQPTVQPAKDEPAEDSTRVIRPKLTILSGADVGKSLSISGKISIGRAEDNVFSLNDRKVSRHHALLAETPYGWVLEDLKSSNGTYLNGALITGPSPVKPGDVLQIGDNDLQFILDLPAAAQTSPECPQCGKPLNPGVAFCGSCGAKLY